MFLNIQMVVVAQLVRASVCGTEGRGFKSRLPPLMGQDEMSCPFFISTVLLAFAGESFGMFVNTKIYQPTFQDKRFDRKDAGYTFLVETCLYERRI